ncbi:unnamed protein product, partial [Schistosoma mattheei]
MKRMWSIVAVTATSAFSASSGMLSGPVALSLLICLMAMLISLIVGGPTLIGWSMGGFSGAGRFKSSLKCSNHLFCCSSMLTITSPSLL